MKKNASVLKLVLGLLVMVGGSWDCLRSEAQSQEFSTLSLGDSHAEIKLIERILSQQAEAWNQGDLEQFMKGYWKSPLLTFSGGGKTVRGWDATLERYQKNYAPPNEMGKLKFDGLEVTLLESKTAMVLGNFHLEMSERKNRSGNFSLVLHKVDDQWRIIHDHSSSLEPEKNATNQESQPVAPGTKSDSEDGSKK